MRSLTQKQRNLCQLYIQTGSKTEAYRRAYDVSRMTNSTIWARAYDEFQKPHVAAHLDELLAQHQKSHRVSVARVIEELEKLAYTDLPGIVDYSGGVTMTLTQFEQLTPAQRACIRKFKVKRTLTGVDVEVELYDKGKALELLGKTVGMYSDRQVHSFDNVAINFNLPEALEAEERSDDREDGGGEE